MGTLCVSGAATSKAGANISATIIAGWSDTSEYEKWILQAETLISQISRYDWVANYGTIKANFKPLLEEISSNLAAIYAIQYDMSGYTSRGEAESMITVLRDAVLRGLQLLRDQKGVTFGK